MKDIENIHKLYSDLKTNRERYKPVWDKIEMYTGIGINPDYMWENSASPTGAGNQLDQFVDDPTSAISVNQAGDYLVGIMWGTGDKAFDIIPSREVLDLVNQEELDDWYGFATEQTLFHMNHSDAGFSAALSPYAYDMFSYGNGGIGTFPNDDFKAGVSENALIYSNFGIDNTCIDEGKSGMVEYIFPVFHWRVNRIVAEFCMTGGKIDPRKIANLPQRVRDAYNAANYNDVYNVVYGTFPRSDFDPKLKGKRGTKYRGVWFMEDQHDNKLLLDEDHSERPISWGRQFKVRGEIYGRSSGSMLMSSIECVNFMVGNAVEILEKMGNPALGMFNNAVMGDNVLDTSPEGITIFNQAFMGNSQLPVFPVHDVGDPSGIIKFLIPYLNEKIVTAFKVDALLDFNTAKEMTATESLQRYAIRGKSLSTMLLQQKNGVLEPTAKRSISLLMGMGELGVNPNKAAARARALKQAGRDERVIPDAVLQIMAQGRPWYKIRWNNELEKLTRTEAVQNLVQVLQAITAIAAINPAIVDAVDWYKLLDDINNNLDYNNQVLIGADQFKALVAQKAQMQQAAMELQAANSASDTQKNTSQAQKNVKDAQNAGKPV